MQKFFRLLMLLVISMGITALLYWIDTDPPTDGIFSMTMNTLMVYGVVIGIVALYQKLRGSKTHFF